MTKPKKSVRLHILITPEDRAAVERWRKEQEIVPSLGEAIRRLIERGLGAENGGNPPDKN